MLPFPLCLLRGRNILLFSLIFIYVFISFEPALRRGESMSVFAVILTLFSLCDQGGYKIDGEDT